jgi:hypothetical protein
MRALLASLILCGLSVGCDYKMGGPPKRLTPPPAEPVDAPKPDDKKPDAKKNDDKKSEKH